MSVSQIDPKVSEQIQQFTAAIFAPDDVVEVRQIHPSRKGGGRSTWHKAAELADTAERLLADNADGVNIYIGGNPRPDHGKRGDKCIILARCLFADLEQIAVADASARVTTAGLPLPTVVVNSGHGIHFYWRLAEPMTDLAAWRQLQQRLIALLNSDPVIHNPERIMRLPGFMNHKPPVSPCELIQADPARVYPLDQLQRLLPPIEQKRTSKRRQQADAGKQSVNGNRNSTLMSLAGTMQRRGMTAEAITEALLAENRQRCNPPLDDDEVRGIAESVSRYEPAADQSADDTIPLGEHDPESGRLVLSPKKTLPTAEAFIRRFYSHADGRTLQAYAGTFMAWRNNRWGEIEDGAIRHTLQPWLHESLRYIMNKRGELLLVDFESNNGTINSALESVRSRTHLPAAVTIPSWLGGGGNRPDPANLLPYPTGTLDLSTGRVTAPTPLLFNVNAIEFDHDADAPEPTRWLAFLDQLWGADQESIDLLQEWFGYALVADTSQQKMLLMVGPKRSGKGTIARVLTQLVGRGNVCGPTTSGLAGPFGLQPLIGKSLAIVSDARFSGRDVSIVIERLLTISGEDLSTVERKHTDSMTLKLPTRFMFLSNELPRLNDASGALAGRFMILLLRNSFYGREDRTLTQTLLAELPGILLWAIAGLKRLRERGHFVQPQAVEDAVQELNDLSSPILAFIRERCVMGAGYQIAVDDLYGAWQRWCTAEGRNTTMTRATFGRNLKAAAPGVDRHGNGITGRVYRGITLGMGGEI